MVLPSKSSLCSRTMAAGPKRASREHSVRGTPRNSQAYNDKRGRITFSYKYPWPHRNAHYLHTVERMPSIYLSGRPWRWCAHHPGHPQLLNATEQARSIPGGRRCSIRKFVVEAATACSHVKSVPTIAKRFGPASRGAENLHPLRRKTHRRTWPGPKKMEDLARAILLTT